MNRKAILKKTKKFVKQRFKGAEGGHDWFHTKRVLANSVHIAKKENANLFVVQLAALLHDIADAKFHDGDETVGPKVASEFLIEHNVDQLSREHIVKIIESVSFKNSFSNTDNPFNSIELQIVQDADRLDAIGAIGIARAFNYGGFKNRSIYDPSKPLQKYADSKAYHKSDAPTINHFYEKLLKLKDLMNTPTGMRIAKERHAFMLQFLDRFYDDCEPGKSGTRTNNSD